VPKTNPQTPPKTGSTKKSTNNRRRRDCASNPICPEATAPHKAAQAELGQAEEELISIRRLTKRPGQMSPGLSLLSKPLSPAQFGGVFRFAFNTFFPSARTW